MWAAPSREGGSSSSIKHFSEAIDLKVTERSPDLDGRRPLPTSTPVAVMLAPWQIVLLTLLNSSIANGSPNLNNSKASDSVV